MNPEYRPAISYKSICGSSVRSAAFQLALWEIIYNPADLILSSGTFRATLTCNGARRFRFKPLDNSGAREE